MATVLAPTFSDQCRDAIRRALLRVGRRGAQIIRNRAVENLSGKVLKVDTGRLRSSVSASASETGRGVLISVGTRVSYGRAWEHGFQIPAMTIVPKTKKALKIPIAQLPGFIFRKKANVPARAVAARPWLRPAFDESTPEIRQLASKEVAKAINLCIPKIVIRVRKK